jgi:immunity protein 5 of polymorphic toxin system
MTYYKVLATDGVSPYHGGSGKWSVPNGKKAGKWMPAIKDVALCSRGYHVVTLEQLPNWIGPTLYEVEIRGEVIAGDDKSVAEQARLIRKVDTWNDKTLRLFAADCAEHVLELYEKSYPDDKRPRNAIQAARDFANGLIDKDAANAAANAAYAAANAAAYAAYAAANAAAYAANAANAAANAAYAAYAANATYATYAANAAERKWQLARLKYYLEIE